MSPSYGPVWGFSILALVAVVLVVGAVVEYRRDMRAREPRPVAAPRPWNYELDGWR